MPQVNLPKQPRATSEQQRFIEILTGDLGFNRKLRNAHINDIVGRKFGTEISYLDELTINEASEVIRMFKIWKEK